MGGERTRESEGMSTWTIILGPCSELRLAVIGLGMEWRTWCVRVRTCMCVHVDVVHVCRVWCVLYVCVWQQEGETCVEVSD